MTVTNTLLNQIRQQIEQHHVLVWYDPEQHYLQLVQHLSPVDVANAKIYNYTTERGFVGLRHDLEPVWGESTTPPRLLIYVPRSRADSFEALIEYEKGGGILQPGQQPPEQNTALAMVTRHALTTIFPPAKVEKICAEVKAGQWTVAGLNQLIEKGEEVDAGVLSEIFGSGNLADIVTGFLSNPELDAELTSRGAEENLAKFLSDALGVPFTGNATLANVRAWLARQLLFTELKDALAKNTPPALNTFVIARQPVAQQAAVDLARAWRNRRDLADSYVKWANKLQGEIGLNDTGTDIPLSSLAKTETFAAGEMRLLTEVEQALVQQPSNMLLDLARKRRDSFWAAHRPALKTRWEVVVDAARLLLEASRVETQLKGKNWSAEKLLAEYALAERPWCILDTVQRHLERDFHRFDHDPHRHATLQKLVVYARSRYSKVANKLATLFVQVYEAQKFELPNVLLQTDIYQDVVSALAKTGRVAYVLVDAFRFEMARELVTLFDLAWNHDLTVALATPPTITEVGMVALLPGAENGLTLAVSDSGKLRVGFAGKIFRDRKDRIDHFIQGIDRKVVTTKLDQLAPLSNHNLRQQLDSAAVVLVTATDEIDGLCENNPALARRMLDDVLNQLRRGIKTLFGLGFSHVVVTADHGYLFGEKLSSGQTINSPQGQTVSLKRRVWIGRGGAQIPGTLRKSLSAFGLGGNLELVTPYNLSAFKVQGGNTEYFHGGLSLPELALPVLTIRAAGRPSSVTEAPIEWTLTLGSASISTMFTSVTIEGQAGQLFVEPPLVRVEVRDGDQPISTPISASYNFNPNTRDVQLAMIDGEPLLIAKNTITLQINETPDVASVTIHLLDATTGLSLHRLENVPFKVLGF